MKERLQSPMFDSVSPLTSRQLEVWHYLSHRISHAGICPTYREIAEHLKIRSANGVRTHLEALERKGYLKRIPHRSRAITLLKKKSVRNCQEIPFLGTIYGDEVTLLVENPFLNRCKKASHSYFYLRVEQAPSFCPKIHKGYLLLIQASPIMEEGHTSVWITPEKELVIGICFYHPAHEQYVIQRHGQAELYFDWKKWKFLGIMKGWVIPVE